MFTLMRDWIGNDYFSNDGGINNDFNKARRYLTKEDALDDLETELSDPKYITYMDESRFYLCNTNGKIIEEIIL